MSRSRGAVQCLEAYINGFVEDHLQKSKSHIKQVELTAKWLFVPALLGKPDCFDTSTQPFQDFAKLIRWRNNDLVHYKHEFKSSEPLGKLGNVSKIYYICNADNSRLAVETVRKMVHRLNEFLGLPVPAWIQETSGTDNWLSPVDI